MTNCTAAKFVTLSSSSVTVPNSAKIKTRLKLSIVDKKTLTGSSQVVCASCCKSIVEKTLTESEVKLSAPVVLVGNAANSCSAVSIPCVFIGRRAMRIAPWVAYSLWAAMVTWTDHASVTVGCGGEASRQAKSDGTSY